MSASNSGAINTSMGPREWGMVLGLSFLWGGSFFFTEVALTHYPPFSLVFLRVGLAAAALWTFVLISGRAIPKSMGAWRAFFTMGLINNVIPFCLIVWGQTQITSGLASILNGTVPLFTVLVAGVMLADERFTTNKIAGVVIGFLGVVLMIGPGALAGLGGQTLAQLAVLGAALSYAFAGTFGRRFKSMGLDPVATAAGQLTASTVILALILLVLGEGTFLSVPSLSAGLAVVCFALFSTALAYLLFFSILSNAGATNVSLVTFIIPVVAILLGVTILGEALEWLHLVGMALILVGVLVIDGRLLSRNRR